MLLKALIVLQKEGLRGIRSRVIALNGYTLQAAERPGNDYAEWVSRYDTITNEIRSFLIKQISRMNHKPLISVVMSTHNSNPIWLKEAVDSVINQIYPYWELCIADDASTDSEVLHILEYYSKYDNRIKIVYRNQKGHISAASNSALEFVTGEWVALLDHDDMLAKHALYWVVDAINRENNIQLIYSDEDKIDAAGKRFDGYFKCDWNIDLFYSQNFITHLGVYNTKLIKELGGFRIGFEGAQDYDLTLRCIERIHPNQIYHIPRVLYHWRTNGHSISKSSDVKLNGVLAGQKALSDHFKRLGIEADTDVTNFGYKIRYTIPDRPPLITIIIPTRNGLHLIKQCIDSILEKTSYTEYQILIVDNGSDDEEVLQYLKTLLIDSRISVLRHDGPFNFSELNNEAVKVAEGEFILLLNNDVKVISHDWLHEMVGIALQPGVGAVGARLWYPDNTLQHGGIILGIGGVAGVSHKYLPVNKSGYFCRAQLTQTLSAVTAACLLIRKQIYIEAGGLNETDLKIAFNDIDFCLRVRELGYRNVWTPYAELYHYESATRGYENTEEKLLRLRKEVRYMQNHWGDVLLNDPAYNPNLTLKAESFVYAWPPRIEYAQKDFN